MDSYSLVLILHLLCAIIFIGFIFADVIVFPALNKVFSQNEVQKIKETLYARGVKIYPLAVLALVLTGAMMFSRYINADSGYFSSSLQQILWLKLFLVAFIALGIIYALISRLLKKQPASFMKHFHKASLVLTLIIAVLAKVMFLV